LPATGAAHTQISLFGAALTAPQQARPAAHIGGSARGYQGLSARLAISTTDEQAGGQAVCLCMASAGRECALLHDMRVIFVRILAG